MVRKPEKRICGYKIIKRGEGKVRRRISSKGFVNSGGDGKGWRKRYIEEISNKAIKPMKKIKNKTKSLRYELRESV